MARVYESKLIRDLLLRAASVPPNSSKMAQLIKEINTGLAQELKESAPELEEQK
jgi:hypothetical protein